MLHYEVGERPEFLGRPFLDVVGDLMSEGVQGYSLPISLGVYIDVDGVGTYVVVSVDLLAVPLESLVDLNVSLQGRSRDLGCPVTLNRAVFLLRLCNVSKLS